jgi:hypothetical protein
MRSQRLLVTLLALLAPLLAARAADACGGLFCSRATTTTPPAQDAERIVFVKEAGSNTLSTYIEIRYKGKAENFAWILPMDVVPDATDIAPKAIFDELDRATAPQFFFTYLSPQINVPDSGRSGCGGGDDSAGTGNTPKADGGVRVLDRGQVGPYDKVVLMGTDASELVSWLQMNDYDVPDSSTPLIRAYVTEGKKFLALKLKDSLAASPTGVAAIEPIKLVFTGTEACVPIRLTRIATAPVLPVIVFSIGPNRLYPTNYTDVMFDYAKQVTPQGVSSYNQLVQNTIVAAGGHGFLTEYAQATTRPLTLGVNGPPVSAVTQELVRKGEVLTRLHMELKQEYMDRDPLFEFRAGPMVNNVHRIVVDQSGQQSEMIGLRRPGAGAAGLALTAFAVVAAGLRRRARRARGTV